MTRPGGPRPVLAATHDPSPVSWYAGLLRSAPGVTLRCREPAQVHRSAGAAALLARRGRDVVNLTGGMRAWARAGLPVVAAGGGPGRVA